jgi:hypothetical protein
MVCVMAISAVRLARVPEENIMKIQRRRFLRLAAGATAVPAVSRFGWAQPYPSRPVRIIVGFPPGPVISRQIVRPDLVDLLRKPQ